MLSDTDSSDDDLMVPNGFVDVDADTVQFDFDQKDSEDSPPSKRKRGKKGKSISSSFEFQNPVDEPSLSTSNTTAPTALESFEILDDDSVDTQEVSVDLTNDTGCRHSKRKLSNKNSLVAPVLDESESVLVSSPELEESQQSSFCFDLEEDISVNIEEDEVIPEEDVKVRVVWKGCETRHFNLRKHQKIKEIYTHYAQQEGVEEDRLLFTLHDKTVSPNDTPSSLNIGVASLEGGVTDVTISKRSSVNVDSESQANPDSLKLFIQRKGVKEKHAVYTSPHEKISVLMCKLSEDLKIPTSAFLLKFDGDPLLPDQTPESLDMEGDECIDLVETK